jgi:hypothetical protein
MTDDERVMGGEKIIEYLFDERGLNFCVQRDESRRRKWNGYIVWSDGSRGLITLAQPSRDRAMAKCIHYARVATRAGVA